MLVEVKSGQMVEIAKHESALKPVVSHEWLVS